MNTLRLTILISFALIITSIQAQNPEKLRRADCFFGVHLDLHASEDITDAGRTLTPEMVDTFLTKVRPDFIQIDCKGHPGISSYPSKVGYHVKGFQKDPLRVWRDATEKNKVGLYMHYSGVWDGKACTEHPDWAIVKASGERSTQKTSFFSPYLDQLMIPQLKELSSEYKVDGAWVDGECWAIEPDYSEKAIQEWKSRTGFTSIPKSKNDANYTEFIEYNRSLFRAHMSKYIDAIHAFDPKFQITSNWAYSSLMPEKVVANVDFLSGDVTPQNGVFRSAFEARCLAPQGKPWDLMAWGFSWNGAKMPMSDKSVIQLKQEAAEIIAMGGGVQFYFQQNRDLSLKPWLAGKLSEIGNFCRERQAYCHKAIAIPQVALLYPTKSYLKNSSSAYSFPTDNLQATLYALLDNQLPVEVLMEHHLSGKTSQYPLIVIPECDYLEPELLKELHEYTQNGGNLLIIGTESTKLFQNDLGILSSSLTEEKSQFISAANRLGCINSKIRSVELNSDCKVISTFY
ncbi:MAG: alpha-L-fucosidase, partial [Bacteroidota bacterium]|nr:alpha-L-fucosidase [Bacteroidota bacterium]